MRRLGAILALMAIGVLVGVDSSEACRGRRSRRCCQPCRVSNCPPVCQPTCATAACPTSEPAYTIDHGYPLEGSSELPPASYDGIETAPMPPATPDDDLPPSEEFPAPKEEPKEDTTGVLEEEMPAEEGSDDSETETPTEGDDDSPPEPAETNTTSVDQPQWRLWTDNTGKHQTKAVLLEVDLTAGKVSLRKENGKRIGVPLSKLSQADQELIRSLAPAVANVTR